MTDPRPPTSPTGDGRPPGGEGEAAPPDDPPHDPIVDDDGRWQDDEDWDEPNYLVRRGVLAAAVVAVIVMIAIVVGRLIGDDGPDPRAATPATEWDTVVVLTEDGIRSIQRGSGDELVSDDRSGLLDLQAVVAGDVLVTLDDLGRITLTDIGDGSDRAQRVGRDRTLAVSADDPGIALVSSDGGGDVTLVRADGRDVVDLADVADLAAPRIDADQVMISPSGTRVAAPVPNLFQSFVVDLDAGTSAALGGRAIALGEDVVVTEQPAGTVSEIEFSDLLGAEIATVQVTTPAATMLTPNGNLLLVAPDGTVATATDDGDLADHDDLVGTDGRPLEIDSGAVAAAGDRLVVTGDGQVAVLGTDGDEIGVVDGELVAAITPSSRCAVVRSAPRSRGGTVVDLTDGEPLGDLGRGSITDVSADGCTVALSTTGSPQVFSLGELIDVDAPAIDGLAPDGSAFVALDGDDRSLVRLDGGDTIELADSDAVVLYGRR